MGSITLNFPNQLNTSVQVGDTAYFTNDTNGKNLQVIGTITAVTSNSITANILDSLERPTTASFILFSKTALANVGSLKGYYADVQFKNDATSYAELFSAGSEIFESSN